MTQESRTPEPVDIDVAWQRAGIALDGLPRDDALHLACMQCDHKRVPWVREAYMRKVLRAKCLGRFDLDNPQRIDLPWPATVFLVQGPSAEHQAMLMVYMAPSGAWEVVDEGPVQRGDGTRGIVVDPRRFRGNLDGLPGTVNGDDAGKSASTERPRPEPSPRGLAEAPSTHEQLAPALPAPAPSARPSRPARAPKPGKGTACAGVPDAPRKPSTDTTPTVAMSAKQEIVLRLLRLLDS